MSIPKSGFAQRRLGELLVSADVISDEQLCIALDHQASEGGKLAEVLVRDHVLAEDQIADARAEQRGLERVSLAALEVDRTAASLIPERLARRKLALRMLQRASCDSWRSKRECSA